jgi:hypothetical protein
MKNWQVLAHGERFVRGGSIMGFELSGFVTAEGPDEAFLKAVSLARVQHPELKQAESPSFPKPVINVEEVQECSMAPASELDRVEVHWYAAENV